MHFLLLLTLLQQFVNSSYSSSYSSYGSYARTDAEDAQGNSKGPPPSTADCGGCSSPCSPKCVAEKGSRVNVVLDCLFLITLQSGGTSRVCVNLPVNDSTAAAAAANI